MGLGLVVGRHELLALVDQFFDAGDAAALDRPLGDDTKPAPHLVHPGGVGGCVVHVEAGPLCLPGFHLGAL